MSMRNREDLLRHVADKLQGAIMQVWEATITNAQVLALFTTPVQVVPVPGPNKVIIPSFAVIEKPAGTAYTVVGVTDVQIGFDTGLAPVALSIDEANFLNNAALESRLARPRSTTAGSAYPDFSLISATGPVDLRNKALYIKAAGANPAAGTSPLRVHTYGFVVPVNLNFSW